MEEEDRKNDRGKCEICEERIVDLAAAPCGHMFCRICWDANLASIRTKYKSARTIARKLKEPNCMMCRTPVTTVIKVFFRKWMPTHILLHAIFTFSHMTIVSKCLFVYFFYYLLKTECLPCMLYFNDLNTNE